MLYCQYRNGLKDIYAARMKEALSGRWKPYVAWLCGETGCGKTRTATEKYPDAMVYHCRKGMQFLDGYEGQDVVIFDEFRYDSLEFSWLLSLIDWSSGQYVPVKGSFTWWHPKVIVFTSPETPSVEFSYRSVNGVMTLRDNYAQFERRLDAIACGKEQIQLWKAVIASELRDCC